MNIQSSSSDTAVLKELGLRIAAARINQQYSQAALAEQAGIGKRTLERMEAGNSAQLLNLIRVMRVLGLLPVLDQLFPPDEPSPMTLLRGQGKRPLRVSEPRTNYGPTKPWRWNDGDDNGDNGA